MSFLDNCAMILSYTTRMEKQTRSELANSNIIFTCHPILLFVKVSLELMFSQMLKSIEHTFQSVTSHYSNSEELRISLCLYVDDFEVCNRLCASLKKHKLCGVYWIHANLPPGSHSCLSSIYLAVLCKSNDVKIHGF